MMQGEKSFYSAAEQVTAFREMLLSVPRETARNAVEIRIRCGRPLVVETVGGSYVCGSRTASADEIEECVRAFCGYSVQSREKELREGWLTLRGGHRAGLSGTASCAQGQAGAIREYTSVNLRIAREHIGAADEIFEKTAVKSGFRGLLILGPPLSAKTTVLRDLCRRLASSKKTAVIDERGEIAAVYRGAPQNDVGLHADVLTGFSKSEGIERAIRLLSPEYLICDEIGADHRAVLQCANRGIKPVLTEHCGSMEEARRSETVRALVTSGAVNFAVLLGGRGELGRIKELQNYDSKYYFFDSGSGAVGGHGLRDVGAAEAQRKAASAAAGNA